MRGQREKNHLKLLLWTAGNSGLEGSWEEGMRLWILYIKNGFTRLGCSSAACVKPWIQSLAAKNESV